MFTTRIACLALAIAGMMFLPQFASAENAISHPAKTSIGGSKASEPVASLAVVNARGATLEGNTLSSPAWPRTRSSSPTARSARPVTF